MVVRKKEVKAGLIARGEGIRKFIKNKFLFMLLVSINIVVSLTFHRSIEPALADLIDPWKIEWTVKIVLLIGAVIFHLGDGYMDGREDAFEKYHKESNLDSKEVPVLVTSSSDEEEDAFNAAMAAATDACF